VATEQGTNRGWRGHGSGQGQGHFHRHSASYWGWPQGKVTGTSGRLFCPRWEKRKDVGGLALAVALPGTEHRWGGQEQGGLHYRLNCDPQKMC